MEALPTSRQSPRGLNASLSVQHSRGCATNLNVNPCSNSPSRERVRVEACKRRTLVSSCQLSSTITSKGSEVYTYSWTGVPISIPNMKRNTSSTRLLQSPGTSGRAPGTCRASLASDWPFIATSVCCIAYSAFPLSIPQPPTSTSLRGTGATEEGTPAGETPKGEGDLGFSLLGDVRYGVMSAVSVVPLFNWMTWLLAWLDTRDTKYAVYACVYAAPLFRFGFDFRPEDSWVQWACFFACILNVQVDTFRAPPQSTDVSGIFPDLGQVFKAVPLPGKTGETGTQGTKTLQVPESEASANKENIKETDFDTEELKQWDAAFEQKQKGGVEMPDQVRVENRFKD